MTNEELAKAIKEAVDWLVEEDEGCVTIKLNEKLAVCVGWSGGFDENDSELIHSKSEPNWVIVAGIKVWTSDDLRTDFDFINSPYYDDVRVWDTDLSISPNDDYDFLTEYLLKEFDSMKDLDIDDDGKINE